MDFFTVTTLRFQVLYVFLASDRASQKVLGWPMNDYHLGTTACYC